MKEAVDLLLPLLSMQVKSLDLRLLTCGCRILRFLKRAGFEVRVYVLRCHPEIRVLRIR